MDAEFAGFVRGGGNDAALVSLAANDHGFAFQRWIEEFLDRDEEGVHVDVKDGLWEWSHDAQRGISSNSFGGEMHRSFAPLRMTEVKFLV